MKRILSIIGVLAMTLSLCSAAFAKEPSRIEVRVENEAEIASFYHSEAYESDKLYSFIIEKSVQRSMICPDCGNNAYKGYTRHDEMDIQVKTCPDMTAMTGDICTEYYIYAYSECDYCGYKTSETFLSRYWIVECSQQMPNEGVPWTTYTARIGQSVSDGYDLHEDPVWMGLV